MKHKHTYEGDWAKFIKFVAERTEDCDPKDYIGLQDEAKPTKHKHTYDIYGYCKCGRYKYDKKKV